jgi:hypothetical protein
MARATALCLALLLAACAHRSEVKTEASVQEKDTAARAVDTVQETHTEQGHKRITTYEYGPPELTPQDVVRGRDKKKAAVGSRGSTDTPDHPISVSGSVVADPPTDLPPHGPLIKMTVEDDDPSSASSLTKIKEREKAEADRLAKEKLQAENSSKPQLPGCGVSGGIWGAAIGLGFLVVLYVLWKLKKLPFIG